MVIFNILVTAFFYTSILVCWTVVREFLIEKYNKSFLTVIGCFCYTIFALFSISELTVL